MQRRIQSNLLKIADGGMGSVPIAEHLLRKELHKSEFSSFPVAALGDGLYSSSNGWQARPTGKLIQSVFASTSVEVVSKAAAWVPTTLAGTITPRQSGSRIIAIVRQCGLGQYSNQQVGAHGNLSLYMNDLSVVHFGFPFGYHLIKTADNLNGAANGCGSASVVWPVTAHNTNPIVFSTYLFALGLPTFGMIVQWGNVTSSMLLLEFAGS